MCSRESYSVVPSRFLAGVFVFLGAFLVGVATARVAFFSDRPTITAFSRPTEERTDLRNCELPDHINLTIRNDVARQNYVRKPFLEIANNGPDPIYLFPYDLWVRGKTSPFEYPAANEHRSDAFQEIEIPSGTTAYLALKNPAPVEAIFRYRIGEARSFRVFTADLTNGCR